MIPELFDLEKNILKLVSKLEQLKQENQDLTAKILSKEKQISIQNLEIKSLKSHFDSVKITNSLLGSDEYKRDTKIKINTLIREIDACIAQLSS